MDETVNFVPFAGRKWEHRDGCVRCESYQENELSPHGYKQYATHEGSNICRGVAHRWDESEIALLEVFLSQKDDVSCIPKAMKQSRSDTTQTCRNIPKLLQHHENAQSQRIYRIECVIFDRDESLQKKSDRNEVV